MKIFYYFQELYSNMFQWQRIHIIDELSRHGVEFTTFNPLLYETPDQANEAALRLIQGDNYDLFFTNVCYYKMLFPETIQRIKHLGIPTLCFRCDNLLIPFNDKKLAPFFDLVWLTSIETKWLYDRWGVNTIFAPYAANPYAFKYEESDIERKVCFIGTPYGSRSIMINSLTHCGVSVDAYCLPGKKESKSDKSETPVLKSDVITMGRYETYINQLRFTEGRKTLIGSIINRFKGATNLNDNNNLIKKEFLPFDEIPRTYSRYALCLSSTSTGHTDALKNPVKVINLRAFEIPMSGGLTLCKYNEELNSYFDEDKEIIFYRTKEELIDKAIYYTQKASNAEIIRLKTNARMRAESEHTWWARFQLAFDVLGLNY